MIPSLSLLSCELSVSIEENPDKENVVSVVYIKLVFHVELNISVVCISV